MTAFERRNVDASFGFAVFGGLAILGAALRGIRMEGSCSDRSSRISYERGTLDETDIGTDPIERLRA